MTRLAVAGLHHETNTFSTILADESAYAAGGIRRGAEMVRHYRGTESTLGGFLAPAGPEVELVPLLDAMVNPCGPVSAGAFTRITGELERTLRAVGPVDGLLLCLHGACVAEGHPSADVDVADRMRAVLGPQVPIGCVVDMHANLDPALAGAVDVLLGYRTNPHVDPAERALTCRELVLRAARTGWRPVTVVEQLPMVVTIARQDTSEPPMSELLALARAAHAQPGVLDVSILEGFPYADVPQMGMSVVVTHEDDRDQARAVARDIGRHVWAVRDGLLGGTVSIEQAVQRLLEPRSRRPVLVLDVGDNIGGGGPGDSTVLLSALAAARVRSVAATINDPAAVRRLEPAVVGDRVEIEIGGRSREQEGRPLPVRGRVTGRHSGLFTAPSVAHGGFRHFDGGTMVGLVTDDDHWIVLTSRAVQPVTPAQFTVVGIDPADVGAVLAKGVNGPRAGFAALCAEHLVVDTPGVTRSSVQHLPYRHRRQPLHPFEPVVDHPPAAASDHHRLEDQ